MPDRPALEPVDGSVPGYRRVLHVMRIKRVCGSENHLLELVQALRSVGWASDAVIPSPEPGDLREYSEALARFCDRVDVVPMGRDLSGRLAARLAHLLASGRYDVAHAHLVHADCHLALASMLTTRRVPLVSSKHNHDPFRRSLAFRLLEQAIGRRYAGTIAISDSLARFTRELSGVEPTTVRYGLSAPAAPPERDPRSSRPPLLLAVGRLEEQKGFDVLLRAMPEIRARVAGAELQIAGEGPDRPKLEDAIARLELTGCVRLLGHRADVPELMRHADLLVHPARWEGFGLVLLEAMREALPVVASAVGAIPEVVANGVTGLLVPPDEPAPLASAVVEMVSDRERAVRIGQAGFQRLSSLFSPERMARAVAHVYDGVLTERYGAPRQPVVARASASQAVPWRARRGSGRAG